MKVRSYLLRTRWLQIISILCLLIMLIPMVLMAKPAHAQSPYADLEAQLQQLQQQVEQLLATYYSMKPEDRAQVDATMAAVMQQTLRQMYTSMSVTDRANLDEQTRQAMGYTFTQLLQMSSTVPGEAKMIGILSNFLRNYYGLTTPITTKPPTTTPQTTKPVTTTTPPTRDITFERPEQGGVVDLTTSSFNLQLRQLYGASSDEQAREIYDKKVNASKQELNADIAASKSKSAALDSELSDFEKACLAKDYSWLRENEEKNLEKAKDDQIKALGNLLLSVPKIGDMKGLDALQKWTDPLKLFGLDIPEIFATLGTKAASGESLSVEDWSNIGAAAASLILFAAPFIVGVGSVAIPIGAGAIFVGAGIDLYCAHADVNAWEAEGKYVQPDVEEYRHMLEYQREKEQISIDYYKQRELRLLNLGLPVAEK